MQSFVEPGGRVISIRDGSRFTLVASRAGQPAVVGLMESGSRYGADVRVQPALIRAGSAPVLSGLGATSSFERSFGEIGWTDERGLTLQVPLFVVGGAVLGGVIMAAMAKSPGLGAAVGAVLGWGMTGLARATKGKE